MLEHGIPAAAAHCNYKLKAFQESDYFDNTTWSFSEIEKCLDDAGENRLVSLISSSNKGNGANGGSGDKSEYVKVPTDFLRC
jgi:hypothetical protein